MPTYLKFGLILGVVSILSQLILYLIDPTLVLDYKIGLGTGILVSCVCIYLAQKEVKEAEDGFLSFGESFVAGWKTYAIGSLLAVLFTYVLFNFIDTSLLEIQKEQAIEMIESMAERFNMPEDQLDAEIDKIENKNFSGIGQYLLNWGFAILIFGSILSALMALFTKNSRPDNPLA
jgi:hypothetical protein